MDDNTNEQRYSLSEFVSKTGQEDKGQGVFELESSKMLEVNFDGKVWIRHGAMVAYKGEMNFEKEGLMERGLMAGLKKMATGEVSPLAKVNGRGKLYVAHYGKKISIIRLNNERINVQGNDILAFEDSVSYDIKMIKKITHALSGGLFYLEMSGTGMIAITTYGDPLTLKVTPDQPAGFRRCSIKGWYNQAFKATVPPTRCATHSQPTYWKAALTWYQ